MRGYKQHKLGSEKPLRPAVWYVTSWSGLFQLDFDHYWWILNVNEQSSKLAQKTKKQSPQVANYGLPELANPGPESKTLPQFGIGIRCFHSTGMSMCLFTCQLSRRTCGRGFILSRRGFATSDYYVCTKFGDNRMERVPKLRLLTTIVTLNFERCMLRPAHSSQTCLYADLRVCRNERHLTETYFAKAKVLKWAHKRDAHLSGNVKLVHHFELIVHPDATLDQVQLAVLKVAEVKLQYLGFLGIGEDFRLETGQTYLRHGSQTPFLEGRCTAFFLVFPPPTFRKVALEDPSLTLVIYWIMSERCVLRFWICCYDCCWSPGSLPAPPLHTHRVLSPTARGCSEDAKVRSRRSSNIMPTRIVKKKPPKNTEMLQFRFHLSHVEGSNNCHIGMNTVEVFVSELDIFIVIGKKSL